MEHSSESRLYTLCRMPEHKLSCSCCVNLTAYELYTHREILHTIKNNSKRIEPKGKIGDYICKELVFIDDLLSCRIHPKITGEKDKRDCDGKYVCFTAWQFERYDSKQKDAFIRFLARQGLDHLTYSRQIWTRELLCKFQGKQPPEIPGFWVETSTAFR